MVEVDPRPSSPSSRASAIARAPAACSSRSSSAGRLTPWKTRWTSSGRRADGADRGRRVEPVPDPAAPEEDPRVLGHERAAHHAAGRRAAGGSVRTPNGTTAKRSRASGSSSSRPASTPSQRSRWRSLAHSVRSAAARCAAAARPTIRFSRARDAGGLAARRLDRLDDGRVVEVDDEPRAARARRARAAAAAAAARRRRRGRGRRRSARRSRRARPRAARSARRPARSAPGAASVTRTSAASARASSYARMAGPAIRSPTGSAETTRTRGVGKPGSMAATTARALRGRPLRHHGARDRRPPRARRAARRRAGAARARLGVRQPARRGAGRAGPLRARARGGRAAARGRRRSSRPRSSGGVPRPGGKGGAAAGRGAGDGAVGREADARVRRPARAQRHTVRLQRPPLGGLGGVPRRSRPPSRGRARVPTYTGTYAPFVYIVPGAAMRTQATRPRPRCAAGRLVSALELPRAADRRGRADRRRRGAGRDGRGADADGRLLRRDPERVRAPRSPGACASSPRGCGCSGRGAGPWTWAALAAGGAALTVSRSLGPVLLVVLGAMLLLLGGAHPRRPQHPARPRRPGRCCSVAFGRRGVVGPRASSRTASRAGPGYRDALAQSLHELDDIARHAVGNFGALDTPLPGWLPSRGGSPRSGWSGSRRLAGLVARAGRPGGVRGRRAGDDARRLGLPAPHGLRRAGPPRAARPRARPAVGRRGAAAAAGGAGVAAAAAAGVLWASGQAIAWLANARRARGGHRRLVVVLRRGAEWSPPGRMVGLGGAGRAGAALGLAAGARPGSL